jgi:serine/threonine-protein kinase
MLDRLRQIERDLGIAPAVATATTTQLRSQADSGELTKVLPSAMVTEPTAAVSQNLDNATLLRRRTTRRRARGAFLLTLVLLLATLAGGVGWWFGSGPGSLVAVPDVAGLTFEEASAALTEDGFVAVPGEESSIDVEPGQAIRSDPAAGDRLDKGTEVTVVISMGPAQHTVTALNGQTAESARTLLEGEYKLNLNEDVMLYSGAEAGIVINASITPRSGGEEYACGEVDCTVFEDDTATLIVSLGPLADVTNMTVDEATRALTDQQLTVGESIEQYSDEIDDGRVIGVADRAEPGNWRPGDSIQLIVSIGPEPVTVPDVIGMNIREAVAALTEAGLRAHTDLPDSPLWDIYRVKGIEPGEGTSQPKGTRITITDIGL